MNEEDQIFEITYTCESIQYELIHLFLRFKERLDFDKITD